MLLEVVALVAFAMPLSQQADTVIPVRAGTRLQVENFNGETVIRTWDRPAMRIIADGDERSRLEIRNFGALLSVKSQSRNGAPRSVDYQITVPVRTDISVDGIYNDVTIDGVQGGITVGTVNGEIDVRGGDGNISLKSVEGTVSLADAKGRISLSSVNEGVSVTNATGDISVDAVNGDVTLERITSANVSVTTVNGDLLYDGTIQENGQYSFNTHNGDIDVTVAPTASATVDVGTFNGEFETDFPVMLTKTSRNRFTFVLGSGSSRLSLESFQGTIRLHRPGAPGGGIRGGNNDRRERERARERERKNRHEERQ